MCLLLDWEAFFNGGAGVPLSIRMTLGKLCLSVVIGCSVMAINPIGPADLGRSFDPGWYVIRLAAVFRFAIDRHILCRLGGRLVCLLPTHQRIGCISLMPPCRSCLFL